MPCCVNSRCSGISPSSRRTNTSHLLTVTLKPKALVGAYTAEECMVLMSSVCQPVPSFVLSSRRTNTSQLWTVPLKPRTLVGACTAQECALSMSASPCLCTQQQMHRCQPPVDCPVEAQGAEGRLFSGSTCVVISMDVPASAMPSFPSTGAPAPATYQLSL